MEKLDETLQKKYLDKFDLNKWVLDIKKVFIFK